MYREVNDINDIIYKCTALITERPIRLVSYKTREVVMS